MDTLRNEIVETAEFGTIITDIHNPRAENGWWVEGEILLHNLAVKVVKTKHGPWKQLIGIEDYQHKKERIND